MASNIVSSMKHLLSTIMQAAVFVNTQQVALNQLALAPVTLAAVFAWNLGLTGQLAAVPDKIRNDLVPSMINGKHTNTQAVDICKALLLPIIFNAVYGCVWCN